jgi:hypothetical protein
MAKLSDCALVARYVACLNVEIEKVYLDTPRCSLPMGTMPRPPLLLPVPVFCSCLAVSVSRTASTRSAIADGGSAHAQVTGSDTRTFFRRTH